MNKLLVIVSCVLLMALTGREAAAQGGRSEAMSPFDAVEWVGEPGAAGSAVHVRVGTAWYQLEAINGLAVPELLAGIEKNYSAKDIVKRFEEDLVEAMGKMSVAPGAAAMLRVREVREGEVAAESKEIQAEWSRQKRQDLRKAAIERATRARDASVTAEEVKATLDALEELIETRSAYAAAEMEGPKTQRWRERLADARARAAEITTRSRLTREVRVIVAAIGDAHAGVSGTDAASAGWLPFLPIAQHAWRGDERRILAVKPDRSGFVAADLPYVVSMDGVPIRAWLDAAAESVTCAAPQLIAERSCRELRDVEALRAMVNPAAVGRREVKLELASVDGGVKREMTMPLAIGKPMYGAWPDARSRMLDGAAAPTGYIRLAEMDSESAAAMVESLREFAAKGARSVVIDVRGNGGGTRDALFALAGALLPPDADPVVINAARPLLVDGAVPEDVAAQLRRRGLRPATDETWSAQERAAIARFAATFTPRQPVPDGRFDGWWYACVGPVQDSPRWTGQVIILQDAACFSATDVFLAATKELPRVTLAGEPSAGGSGAAREHELPQRIKVRLSSMVSFQPSGERFDGVGVQPDVRFERDAGDAIDADRWVRRAAELAPGDR